MYTHTEEQCAQIGPRTMFLIAQAQTRIERERRVLAMMAPPLFYGHTNCPYHGPAHERSKCNRAWDEMWWGKFGKSFLNPLRPLGFKDAFEFIQSSEFPGVTKECKEEAETRIIGGFDIEEQIITAVQKSENSVTWCREFGDLM
ncbi:hypothetical protein K435DRAFT_793391 [Dendrothele bispora CBS 962.96]|uniref:Uncharacterized protein n=1 Tax=Dendrothele bispora (strain CBS 962.96) TaxID=1314807 RepID=A0A4S8MGQ7_DENBC|nr:hypothetical protein K435DRAFT_793391 [Dendrothele bispora CBS 962.96]